MAELAASTDTAVDTVIPCYQGDLVAACTTMAALGDRTGWPCTEFSTS
jgi:hypothetical protein